MRLSAIPPRLAASHFIGAIGRPIGRSIKHLFVLCAFSALAGAAFVPAALALDSGPYSMEILVNGSPVREIESDGRAYIEALAGREYSVRLTNRTGERVAFALSVDGLNSIDARTTTSGEAAKWILDPWQSITLDGWQTGASTARRFFFTTERKSYGAWLGSTKNLGLVTAAVFREKRPAPIPWSRYGLPGSLERWRDGREHSEQGEARRDEALGTASAGDPLESTSAGQPSGPASADQTSGPAGADPKLPSNEPKSGARREAAPPAGDAESNRFRAPSEKRAGKPALSDELAATGIGREVGHLVQRIEFDEEEVPAAVLEVRYEYRDALIRLGVLPLLVPPCDRLAERERARGFDDSGYAPDPYGRHRR